ncbi:MAG: hypothetical protein ACRELG_06825 [Gemmataceae bacterium]
MKKISLLLMKVLIVCTGCTTVSLEQYTLNQNRSSGDTRDRLILNCLATVAADPNTSPSFAIYTGGVTTITDSVMLGHTITWQAVKYTLEALALTANRQPKGQWTADPVDEYQQIEALHAACLWALFGPDSARTAYDAILGDPKVLLDNKPHFGVEERLNKLPPKWLHVGRHKDVPSCARYKGHCGDTWVWVMPDDSESFAQFTLVFQDIATLDPTIMAAPPLIVQLTAFELTKLPDTAENTKSATIATSQYRFVKPEHRAEVDAAISDGIKNGKVNLTRAQWLAYTEPYFGQRDGTGITSLGTASSSLTGRAQSTRFNMALPIAPASSIPIPQIKLKLPQ